MGKKAAQCMRALAPLPYNAPEQFDDLVATASVAAGLVHMLPHIRPRVIMPFFRSFKWQRRESGENAPSPHRPGV